MVYRQDNRKRKNHGRYVILGIILGIVLTIGGFYVYDNYKQPILDKAKEITPENIIQYGKSNQIVKSIVDNPIVSQQDNQVKTGQSLAGQKINISDLEYQIHERINYIRENNGLKPLTYNYKIADIARSHSQDMSVNNYFDHTSPNGESVRDRFSKANYPCFTSGENIQENYLSTPDLVDSIVHTWMNSQGHKENILREYFSSEGIGIYGNMDDIMITEDFC